MMQCVVETRAYLRAADEEGVSEAERIEIIDAIAADPLAGDLIKDTGGARKVRFAGRGKGKSGGYRIIYYFADSEIPIFLMDIYGKATKADISAADRKALRVILSRIADDYQRSF